MEGDGRSSVGRPPSSRRAIEWPGNGGFPVGRAQSSRRAAGRPGGHLVLVAVAIAVLVGAAAALYEATRPATYRSTAVLLIDQPGVVASSQDDGIITKLSRLRVRYVDIVGTTAFEQPLAQQVALPLSEVHSAVQATYDLQSLLVRIIVTLPRAEDARRVAQAAAQLLVGYTQQEQSSAGIPDKERVTFTIVSPADTVDQVTPDRGRAILIGAVVFAGLGVAGVLGAEMVRRQAEMRAT